MTLALSLQSRRICLVVHMTQVLSIAVPSAPTSAFPHTGVVYSSLHAHTLGSLPVPLQCSGETPCTSTTHVRLREQFLGRASSMIFRSRRRRATGLPRRFDVGGMPLVYITVTRRRDRAPQISEVHSESRVSDRSNEACSTERLLFKPFSNQCTDVKYCTGARAE